METKQCLECEKPFFGRSDKKFCSNECRTSYNNKVRKPDEEIVNRVNRILRKNRNILNVLSPEGKAKRSREDLLKNGFDFQHFTSIYLTKEKREYRFCYEWGYLELEGGSLLIVKREPDL